MAQDTEALIVQLILSRHLVEEFVQTAYTTNVYFIPGPKALQIIRFEREDLEKAPRIEFYFRKPERKGRQGGKENQAAAGKQTTTITTTAAATSSPTAAAKTVPRKFPLASGSAETKKRGWESSDIEDEIHDDDDHNDS